MAVFLCRQRLILPLLNSAPTPATVVWTLYTYCLVLEHILKPARVKFDTGNVISYMFLIFSYFADLLSDLIYRRSHSRTFENKM